MTTSAPAFGVGGTQPAFLSLGQSSSGSGSIAVPDVVGLSEEQALTMLRGFGFATEVVEVPGPGTDRQVYGQQPRADDVVAQKSLVRVFLIANPPSPVDIGKRLDAIDEALKKAAEALAALTATTSQLETEATAATRHKEIMERLDRLAGTGGTYDEPDEG